MRITRFEWAVRLCFAVVFAWNVLCALQFLIAPDDYLGAYQLAEAGAAGSAAIRGLGVAFLMWNATYPAFLWRPCRYGVLGFVIVVQQAIGLAGEMIVLGSLEGAPVLTTLAGSVMRFVAFDFAGLIIMVISFAALRFARHKQGERNAPAQCSSSGRDGQAR